MKSKNKKLHTSFFMLAFYAGFFIFSRLTFASSTLKLGAIQYSGGPGKTHEDYVEIINTSESVANLKGYRLAKKTSDSSDITSIKSWTSDTLIVPGGKHLWANSENDFSKDIHADSSTTQTITEGNGIALILGSTDDGTIIDSVNWSNEASAPPSEGKQEYNNKIIISELLPHPGAGQEEYIELYNPGEKDLNLENYILRDGSGSGKYILPKDTKIKNSDYLVIYKKDFKFALNDSGTESVSLYDPNEELVDKMSYSSSKENYSWNFDGARWRLSPFLTPENGNIFEKILVGKVKMDKEIYTNIYASFEAKADKDAQKFTWNFGDGHKSYVKNTKHKYEKAGKYEASLKIAGNGEANLYNFTVKVENYDAPKIRIVSIVPNPKGKDSGEYITIKNESKEKVNLKNWSVAMGWEKLTNHPIREDFKLKKGKSKKLKKKICAYALNNTKTKIELRDPTGNVVQKIKYDRTKNKIEDDEIFELAGKDWQWNAPPNNSTDEESSKSPPLPSGEDVPSDGTGEGSTENTGDIIIIPESEIEAGISKSTPDASWQNRKDSRTQLISYGTVITTPKIILQNQPLVLGASDEKYTPPEKHWAASLFDNSVRKINFGLNWVIRRLQ